MPPNKLIAFLAAIIVGIQILVPACAKKPCATFQRLIKETYNFSPSQISDKEKKEKDAALDRLWQMVKEDKTRLLPCLKTSLSEPGANPFFKFDGSNLLVEIDPGLEAKTLQIRNYAIVNLDDVDLKTWVTTLALRGAEGFDISQAAAKWMTYPNAKYFLIEHGGFEVGLLVGAVFLYGSMDEAFATPALVQIASDSNHPHRLEALILLMHQLTSESLHFLRTIAVQSFPEEQRSNVESLLQQLKEPNLLKPSNKPRVSRENLLIVFENMLNGDSTKFRALIEKIPDVEKDIVAEMQVKDIALLRKVRRKTVANASPEGMLQYRVFTDILWTLMWKHGIKE